MLRIDINLLFTIINILVWAWIIKRFLFAPVEKILEQRRQAIEGEHSAARQDKEAAEDLRARYENALSGVAGERAELLSRAQEDAKREYDHILSEASKKAQQEVLEARRRGEEERQRILQEAGRELSGIVAEAAAKVAGGEAASGQDAALYDQFLRKAGESSETGSR